MENLLEDIESGLEREELTRNVMLEAMNSVNPDLKFTMELVTDFEDRKMPTLSFSIWPGEDRIMHTYFEKSMKNQTLMMENSSIGRQSMMAIMTNEMRRRLEVLDHNLPIEEKIEVIDKYTKQLVNSNYNWKQIRDIIVSALVGHIRREERKMENSENRYRSGIESLQTREHKS